MVALCCRSPLLLVAVMVALCCISTAATAAGAGVGAVGRTLGEAAAAAAAAAEAGAAQGPAQQSASAEHVAVQEVEVGKGPSTVCGTSVSLNWQPQGADALYVDVDSTMCQFRTTPQYVANVVEPAGHTRAYLGQLEGATSILRATRTRFRVIVMHSEPSSLAAVARAHGWVLSWAADAGTNTGVTLPQRTGWRDGRYATTGVDGALFVDVDTSACGFDPLADVRYFVSLRGELSFRGIDHWRTHGANIVHHPTPVGFRVYIISYNTQPVTPELAEDLSWAISFIGMADGGGGSMVAGTSVSEGWETVPWRKPGPHGEGPMFMDVDTSRSRYLDTPTYVFSIATDDHDTRAVGSMIVHHPYPKGFRLYVGEPMPGALLPAVSATFARQKRWRVSYIGIEQPRPTRAILTEAKLYGETTATFSSTKKHLFLTGLAAALEVPAVDVALMAVRMTAGASDAHEQLLVLELRVEVANGAAAAAAVARLSHQNFVLRLSKMIKLNTPKAHEHEAPLISPLTMEFRQPRVVLVTPARHPGQLARSRMWTWCVAGVLCAVFGLWALRQIGDLPEAAQVFRRELQLSPSQARQFIQPGDAPPPGFRVIPVAEQRLLAKARQEEEEAAWRSGRVEMKVIGSSAESGGARRRGSNS